MFHKPVNQGKICLLRFPKQENTKEHRFQEIQLNPFPNKPWFLRVCSLSLLKSAGKKEITRYTQGRQQVSFCGNGLKHLSDEIYGLQHVKRDNHMSQ